MAHDDIYDLYDSWTSPGAHEHPLGHGEQASADARLDIEHTFLLGPADTGYAFLVTGERFACAFPDARRDAPVLELWKQEDRARVALLLADVARRGQPIVASSVRRTVTGHWARIEMAFTPLRLAPGAPARILGGIKPWRSLDAGDGCKLELVAGRPHAPAAGELQDAGPGRRARQLSLVEP